VGGVMAPIWQSYIEPGKTNAILYVVDASSPETLGASTIHLIELLSHNSIANITPVLIVFRFVLLSIHSRLSTRKDIYIIGLKINRKIMFCSFSAKLI
jgi:hypothetical protein